MLSSSRRLLLKGSSGSRRYYLGSSSSPPPLVAAASSSSVVWGEKVPSSIGDDSSRGGGNNHRTRYTYQPYQANHHHYRHQYLSKMSFHFGSTEYASCFENIPTPNTNDIRTSSLEYLKSFNIQQWYDDPVSFYIFVAKFAFCF